MNDRDRVVYQGKEYEVIEKRPDGIARLSPLFGSWHIGQKSIEVPILETTVSEKCKETYIPEHRSWGSHPCNAKAVTEKGYCRTHDPEEAKKRAEKRGPTRMEREDAMRTRDYERAQRWKRALEEISTTCGGMAKTIAQEALK